MRAVGILVGVVAVALVLGYGLDRAGVLRPGGARGWYTERVEAVEAARQLDSGTGAGFSPFQRATERLDALATAPRPDGVEEYAAFRFGRVAAAYHAAAADYAVVQSAAGNAAYRVTDDSKRFAAQQAADEWLTEARAWLAAH